LKARNAFSGFFGFILVITLLLLFSLTTLNQTLLNPAFVTAELDKLDAYSIATEQLSSQLSDMITEQMPEEIGGQMEGEASYEQIREIVAEQLPGQMQTYITEQLPEYGSYMPQVIEATLADLGTWMDEQIDAAAQGINAYLTEGTEINITISLAEVKPVLKDNLEQAIRESPPPEMAGLPPAALDAFIEQARAKIDSDMPQQIVINEDFLGTDVMSQLEQAKSLSEISTALTQIIDEILADLKPWMKAQAATVINSGYAYLNGETDQFSIVIPLEQVRITIEENLEQVIRENIPSDAGISQNEIDTFIDQILDEAIAGVPQEITIDEALLGPGVMSPLQQAREIIGYVDTAFKALIGLAVLLIVFISLLQWRRLKSLCHHVGVAFTTAGAIGLAGALIARSILPQMLPRLAQIDIPAQFTEKILLLISDLSQPMVICASSALVVGIVLLVTSRKLKPPTPKPQDTLPKGINTSTTAEEI
jgi:hypothetical protein